MILFGDSVYIFSSLVYAQLYYFAPALLMVYTTYLIILWKIWSLLLICDNLLFIIIYESFVLITIPGARLDFTVVISLEALRHYSSSGVR